MLLVSQLVSQMLQRTNSSTFSVISGHNQPINCLTSLNVIISYAVPSNSDYGYFAKIHCKAISQVCNKLQAGLSVLQLKGQEMD